MGPQIFADFEGLCNQGERENGKKWRRDFSLDNPLQKYLTDIGFYDIVIVSLKRGGNNFV